MRASKQAAQETPGYVPPPPIPEAAKRAAPPIMPPDLARECLADAAIAAIGLLDLLAAAIQSEESAAAILAAGYGRACIVTMIRQTACHLNGALSDAGM